MQNPFDDPVFNHILNYLIEPPKEEDFKEKFKKTLEIVASLKRHGEKNLTKNPVIYGETNYMYYDYEKNPHHNRIWLDLYENSRKNYIFHGSKDMKYKVKNNYFRIIRYDNPVKDAREDTLKKSSCSGNSVARKKYINEIFEIFKECKVPLCNDVIELILHYAKLL